MGEGTSRPVAALLAAALGALCLSACGGGSGGSQTATSSETSTSEASSETAAKTNSPNATNKAHHHFEGGEKSIEDYGAAAAGSDRSSILATFTGYLNAIAEGDPKAACSYLSARVQESLAQLAGKSKKGVECAQILPKLLSSAAAPIARQQAKGNVTRVRVKGDQAFVVFHAPGAKLYMLPLVREDGGWKSTTVTASVLVPSLEE